MKYNYLKTHNYVIFQWNFSFLKIATLKFLNKLNLFNFHLILQFVFLYSKLQPTGEKYKQNKVIQFLNKAITSD